MKVVITEQQYQMVLNERIGDQVNSIYLKLDQLVKKIIADVKKQFGISARFALTYGAGIGALMEPVNKYLSGEFTGLEPWQISSLVIASLSIVFFEGVDYRKMKDELSNQGLEDELGIAIERTEKLKEKFAKMLDVLGVSLYKAGDIVAYTFLLPILSMLINVVNTFGSDSIELDKFIETLLTSGLITVSSVVLRDVIQKIAKLVSNKKTK